MTMAGPWMALAAWLPGLFSKEWPTVGPERATSSFGPAATGAETLTTATATDTPTPFGPFRSARLQVESQSRIRFFWPIKEINGRTL